MEKRESTIDRLRATRLIKTIFIAICVIVCYANAELLDEVTLSKDEEKTLVVFAENIKKTLTFRWTLYKDRGLVVHLKYDDNPHQFVLYKEHLNAYKVVLSSTNNTTNENPHIMIYFVGFDDYKQQAKFRYYLFADNISVM